MTNSTRINRAACHALGFHRVEAARRVAGSYNNTPITLVEGDSAPKFVGEGFFHTNFSGELIRHPGAYGWPMQYHCSTLAVEVGIEWAGSRA